MTFVVERRSASSPLIRQLVDRIIDIPTTPSLARMFGESGQSAD
jgi:hypothetical protein